MSTKEDKLFKASRWTFSGRARRSVASTTSSYNTSLNLTDEEAFALAIIGSCLFKYRLDDWKACKAGNTSMADRKKTISRVIGDRYAYAITRLNNDQLRLQKDNIKRDKKLKETENKTFEKRIEQARKWISEHPDVVDENGKPPARKDYNPLSYEEWGRYQHNQSVLAKYEQDEYVGVTFGGKTRQRIAVRALQREPDACEAREKHEDWKLSRYNIYAIGDSSHACGNSVLRLDANGNLRILVPAPVRNDVGKLLGRELEDGKYMTLSKPVKFHYGWEELLGNISENKSVTSSITYDDEVRCWRLTSTANTSSDVNVKTSEAASEGGSVADGDIQSFATGKDNPAIVARNAVKDAARDLKRETASNTIDRSCIPSGDRRRFMGLDLNYGHIDLTVCDIHGNPCGRSLTIPYSTVGNSKQLKSSLLHALDRIKHICEYRNVEVVFIEELKGFLDGKSRVLNGGGRDFRRWVSSIPSGSFKEWLTRKLTSSKCHVELVPAAYTSQAAAAYWSDIFPDGHQGASLMIARRGLGLGLFRRVPNSPDQSGATGSEVCSADRLTPAPDAAGGEARTESDCGEEAGSPATDNCDAPVLKSDLLGKLRQTHDPVCPVAGQVPCHNVTVIRQ